jgi:hypothetical protein
MAADRDMFLEKDILRIFTNFYGAAPKSILG